MLGAVCVTQVARGDSAATASTISFQHTSLLMIAEVAAEPNPFKDEMGGFSVNTVMTSSFHTIRAIACIFNLQGFAAACQKKRNVYKGFYLRHLCTTKIFMMH